MNGDLISRSTLLDGYDVRKVTEYDESGCGMTYKAVPVEAIEQAPTVDAVEVVRCRDCLNCGMKASIKYDGYRDDVRLCMLHGIAILPDDYCSGGVKADVEVEG